MKQDIHPEYHLATVKCVCGNTFQTHATVKEIHLEICNACHPFFTGKQKFVDTAGRVERFRQKYAIEGEETPTAKRKRVRTGKSTPKTVNPEVAAQKAVKRADARREKTDGESGGDAASAAS